MLSKETFMRALLPLALVAMLATAAVAQVTVGGPTEVQDPNYPLKVRILERNVTRGFSIRTWGRADLYTDGKAQGFDYQADCDMVFMVSRGDERYSARWKKPNMELEMLVSKMGTGKNSKCTVKADLKPFVYEFQRGVLGTVPMDNK